MPGFVKNVLKNQVRREGRWKGARKGKNIHICTGHAYPPTSLPPFLPPSIQALTQATSWVKKESEKIGVPAKFRKRTMGAPQVGREGGREGSRKGWDSFIHDCQDERIGREKTKRMDSNMIIVSGLATFLPSLHSPKPTPSSLPPSLPL